MKTKIAVCTLTLLAVLSGCSSTPGTLADSANSEPQQAGKSQGQSIAVLPFINMTPGSDGETLVDDITESINHILGERGADVASNSASSQFKNINADPREIGETLGVDYILEGSARSNGERIRITAQLILAFDGYHLWSATYDREMSDLQTIQQEIGGAVASVLSSQ